jgi:hypothetical protein
MMPDPVLCDLARLGLLLALLFLGLVLVVIL